MRKPYQVRKVNVLTSTSTTDVIVNADSFSIEHGVLIFYVGDEAVEAFAGGIWFTVKELNRL